MDIIEEAIRKVAGGRVLDVATQEGHFIQLLMKSLQSYTQITGVDVDRNALTKGRETIPDKNIQFLAMNAERMGFLYESFDTISISASFHHLPSIHQVLLEIKRVLKPGGSFILAEMHRDGQTEAELTSVYLHHWVGNVDTASGHVHNQTLGRQELIAHVATLGLRQVEFHDVIDRNSDPMEKIYIEQLDKLIDRIIQQAKVTTLFDEFKRRGEELRRRLHKVGAQREPRLIVIGKK